MYILAISDPSLSDYIIGRYTTREAAELAAEYIRSDTGRWVKPWEYSELDLGGDMLFSEPDFHVMDEGEARAYGLID